MAVDVYYSDNFVGMISPRLSFSRDLETNNNNESTADSISNDYICALESTFDFAFNINNDSVSCATTTSADELFSDGKIIPTRLKSEQQPNVLSQQQQQQQQQQTVSVKPCLDPQTTTATEGRKKSLKEYLEDGEDEEEPNIALVPKTAFWKFRRSNSLNCDRNQRKGLKGSWKILSRSGSTGKFLEKIVEEEKPIYTFHQKLLSKFSRNNSLNNYSENAVITPTLNNNKGLSKSSSRKALRRSHSTSDHHYYSKSDSNSDPNHFRRSHSTGSALKKKQQSQKLHHQNSKVIKDNNSIIRSYYTNQQNSNNNNSNSNSNSNSLKVNPMLNLPSPYISRVSVDLLGFGSLFCNGSNNKDRKKK